MCLFWVSQCLLMAFQKNDRAGVIGIIDVCCIWYYSKRTVSPELAHIRIPTNQTTLNIPNWCFNLWANETNGHEKKEANKQGLLIDGVGDAQCAQALWPIQTLLIGLLVFLLGRKLVAWLTCQLVRLLTRQQVALLPSPPVICPYGKLIASLGHTLAHVPHSVQASASIL